MRVILGKTFRIVVRRGSIIWPHKRPVTPPVGMTAPNETAAK